MGSFLLGLDVRKLWKVLAINAICSYYSVTSGLVLVGCDNLGALHQVQQLQELTPCNFTHADLIQAICQVFQSLTGLRFTLSMLKGIKKKIISLHLAMLHSAQYFGQPTGKASSSAALSTLSVPSGAPCWRQLVTSC